MPLFAKLLQKCFEVLFSFFSKFLAVESARRWAQAGFYVALTATFLAAISVCLLQVYAMMFSLLAAGAVGYLKYFSVGIGMVIPTVAAPLSACYMSTWIACWVYRQKTTTLLLAA